MQLVITEKPSVAKMIAEVMGAKQKRNGYFEGEEYLVSWCFGHLIVLAEPEQYGEQWKRWSYESLPIQPDPWQYKVREDTKEQYEKLVQLMNDSRITSLICATDAGREGELIFRLVVEQAGCKKPVQRLWISSMEETAIREGFQNLRPAREYDALYDLARCRQWADWLVGINGTRLFTVLYGGKVLKVGRVQTPTLAMIVEREEAIVNFQASSYFVLHLLWKRMDAVSEKIWKEEDAKAREEICQKGKGRVVAIKKEQKTLSPPKLYDLTTLQREANRIFGFTAKQTLEYAQSLYEKKLITYPRTDSSYLPEDMKETAKQIQEMLLHCPLLGEWKEILFDITQVLNGKKVTDHHAILPTLEMQKKELLCLPETERLLLSLIANRFLCAIGEKYQYETVKVELECQGFRFTASGKNVLQKGWKELEEYFFHSFYKKKNGVEMEEIEDFEKESILQMLPILLELTEGMELEEIQIQRKKQKLPPPPYFTEGGLLAAMEQAGRKEISEEAERKGLGTPATRADIIEKLVKDGLIHREKKQIRPTEEGKKVIAILPDRIKSPQLTADWENALALVAKGKMGQDEFMEGIETMVLDLIRTNSKGKEEQTPWFVSQKESLGICPNCKGVIQKGKYGAYCVNRCGMNVKQVMGVALTDEQVKALLSGEKILLQGLKSKTGTLYDAFFIPDGLEEYHYKKDGKEIFGIQFRFSIEFPKDTKQKKVGKKSRNKKQ